MFLWHCAYLSLCAHFGCLSGFVCMNGCLDHAHDPWRVRVCSVHSSVDFWGGEGPGRLVARERIFSLQIFL